MRCLSSAKLTMKADILRQGVDVSTPTPDPENPEYGEWINQQDPLTHEIQRVWVPRVIRPDDTATTTIDETQYETINCSAKATIGNGVLSAGLGEDWGKDYRSVEYVRLTYPKSFVLTARDRVTNIRNRNGDVLWVDEETDPLATSGWRATVFDVVGTAPITDPFGNHIENMAILQKAQAYG